MEQEKTHVRAMGTVDEGRDNEDGLSQLLLLRALRQWPRAEMTTNMVEAKPFDDIVLLRPPSGSLLIQLKHKSKDYCVSSGLLKGDDTNFGLKHYFNGFRDLWKNAYLQKDFGIDIITTKVILYTNAKVSCAPGPPVEEELLHLLSTGTPGRAYYLNPLSHSYLEGELAAEFFERFIIFSEQAFAKYLPLLVQQEIVLSSGIVLGVWDATRKFCEMVHRKNRTLGKVTFMSARADCCQILKEIVSKETRMPDGVHISQSSAKANGCVLKEAFRIRPVVTMVLSDSCSQLRSCVAVQSIRTFSSFPVFLANADNVFDALELWRRMPSTLVLDEEDLPEAGVGELGRILSGEFSEESPVLLMSRLRDRRLSRALSSTFVKLKVSVADLDSRSRVTFLSSDILLQGAEKPVPLSSLAPESVWPHLQEKIVSSLLQSRPSIVLGMSLPPPPPHYIQRELRCMIPVQMDLLKDPLITDVLMIEGEGVNNLPADNFSDNKQIHWFPSVKDAREYARKHNIYSIRDLHRKLKIPIHHIEFNSGSLFLADTIGGLENLFKYMDSSDLELLHALGSFTIRENDLLSRGLRLISLSSYPGMGKTSILLQSARRVKEEHPSWWVFVLIMNRHCKRLAEMRNRSIDETDVSILLEEAAQIMPQSTLSSQLAHCAVWETGACAVFIDGFDEIAPDYTEVVEAVIRVLVRSPVKLLFSTTRPVTRDRVNEALGVTSLDLLPLTAEDQFTLMKNLCQSDNPGMEQRVRRVLDSFIQNPNFWNCTLITGSPLIVRFLAEITCNDTEIDIFEEKDSQLNLFDLYSLLLERTFKLFLEEKQKKDLSLPSNRVEVDLLWKECLNKHFICALSVVLPSDIFKTISEPQDFSKILQDIRDGEDKIGFLVEVMSDHIFFVHQTIAEFFVAKWMSKNWRNYHETTQCVMHDSKLTVVRYFLNECFLESFPFHRQVFRNPSRKPEIAFAVEHLLTKDDAGRTPLHIAASTGEKRISELLVELGANMEEKEDMCDMTPLYYAALFQSWDCVRLLLDRGAHVEDNYLTHRYAQELREAGVPIPERAFEATWPIIFLNSPVFKDSKKTIFDVALLVGHEECALWFKSNYEIKKRSETRGGFFEGMQEIKSLDNAPFLNRELLKAVQSGNHSKMDRLLGQGADVTASDAEGNTSLHIAARSGKTVLVATLARRGADLNAVNGRNETPEMVALEESQQDSVELLRHLNSTMPQDSAFMAGLRLIDAASQGRLEDVRRYLLTGTSTVISRFPRGSTALHEAARNGHVEVVSLLCKSGACIDLPDLNGETPLHTAAERGNTATVCCLIKNGADIENNVKCYLLTSLHVAARAGHVEVVRHLVDSGANLEAKTRDFDTPLHLAAQAGHFEVVSLLLQKKLSPDCQNSDGETPLHLASGQGHCGTIEVLMSAGARADMPDKYLRCTPLHVCVQRGHTRAALIMIKKRPELLGLPDWNGNNPLNAAQPDINNLVIREVLHTLESAEQFPKESYGCIMDLMIKAVEDRDKGSSLLNNIGNLCLPSEYFQKAFLVAAGSGNLGVVRELLDANIDKNIENKDGFTALHFAAAEGQVAIIKLLLEEGAHYIRESFTKMTPFEIALKQKQEEAAIAFLAEGVKLDVLTQNREVLLRESAQNGLSKVVERLLDMDVDCNTFIKEEPSSGQWREWDSCKEPFGISALHFAARDGHEKVVFVLLAKGARVDIRDTCGRTALHEAWLGGHRKVAEMLIKAGADEHIRDSNGYSPRDLMFRKKTKLAPN